MFPATTPVPDRLAVGLMDARALQSRAASGDPTALAGAARQFEAMLVTQMLRNMRAARLNAEDDPMTGGEAMKLYRDLLDQQWAARISQGRGLGFAELITQALERNAPRGGPAGPTAAAPQPHASAPGGDR